MPRVSSRSLAFLIKEKEDERATTERDHDIEVWR